MDPFVCKGCGKAAEINYNCDTCDHWCLWNGETLKKSGACCFEGCLKRGSLQCEFCKRKVCGPHCVRYAEKKWICTDCFNHVAQQMRTMLESFQKTLELAVAKST